jgi:hypothetical protein
MPRTDRKQYDTWVVTRHKEADATRKRQEENLRRYGPDFTPKRQPGGNVPCLFDRPRRG